MDGPHLIYFSDPMCSWCYGFSPVIAEIRRTYGRALPIRLVMGGLRPGTETVMTDEAKAEIRGHWEHVREAAGVPFSPNAMSAPDFRYDTDPAARAVVRVRREDPDQALAYLGRVQRAFYAEGQDVTRPEVLADLAIEHGIDRATFLDGFEAEDLKQETWADYGVSQRAGVRGFPTLVGGPDANGVYGVVTRGFQPGADVLSVLHRWLDASPAGTA